MGTLSEYAATHEVAIKVADGGYIVHYCARGDDGDWVWRTSVFTDLCDMAIFVSRAIRQYEGGGGELQQGDRLGNLRVE